MFGCPVECSEKLLVRFLISIRLSLFNSKTVKMPDFLGDEMRKVKKDDKEEEKEIKCK